MVRVFLASAAALLATTPAFAQMADDDWTGFYAGGRLGYAFQPEGDDESILFDKNLDRQFGDTVTTAAGANAFSPGFCDGGANSAVPGDGCDDDEDGIDWAVHAGGDYQFGQFVLGGLIEYGRADLEDSVSAFSTTPANYVMTRKMRGTFGVRARAGVAVGNGFLPYVTAGLVRAKVKSSFRTTNGANAFATEGGSKTQNGYRVGAGLEKRFGNFSLGALYLYTSVKDDDFRVNVTQGTAPATNPFILTNPAGTQFRRSDERFSNHSLGLTASYRF
jgi:outer membrane immunogenic protein